MKQREKDNADSKEKLRRAFISKNETNNTKYPVSSCVYSRWLISLTTALGEMLEEEKIENEQTQNMR